MSIDPGLKSLLLNEGGNNSALGLVDGIVYDDRQLSKEEAERAARLRAVDSSVVVNNSHEEAPMAAPATDPQEFQTAELGPAVSAIVKETKTGYKTTEFWITLGVSLLTVLDGIPLPEKYEAVVVGAITAIYVLSRGLAKQGVPEIEAPAAEEVTVVAPSS